MTEIRKCAFDSPSLVDSMKWLSGSDEWRAAHGMDFHRSAAKEFYLLTVDGVFAGICSRKGKYVADVHILPEYRGNGYAASLLERVSESGTWMVTDNPRMYRILAKLGYRRIGDRGRYQKWRKD